MSFIDWMNASMAVDVACLVFFIATVWKLRSIQKQITHLKEDLDSSLRSPRHARRVLNKRKQ